MLSVHQVLHTYGKRHGTFSALANGYECEVPGVRLYCGINEKRWNHHSVAPGRYACVSPVYGKREGMSARSRESRVFVPPFTEVIQDSGAFCDGPADRLNYWDAWMRQIRHGRRYNYEHLITHRASYDLLIDERWVDGVRHKERWSEDLGWEVVERTVEAAAFLASTEHEKGRILSAQGSTPRQYLQCTERVLEHLDVDRDIFGLGGWCITGRQPAKIMPNLRETLALVMPALHKAGVLKTHIWGVIYPPALGVLLRYAHQYGIDVSTDSAGPTMNPASFGRWGYGDWVDKSYMSPPPGCQCEALGRCRGLDRAEHVRLTRAWLERFWETRYYREAF